MRDGPGQGPLGCGGRVRKMRPRIGKRFVNCESGSSLLHAGHPWQESNMFVRRIRQARQDPTTIILSEAAKCGLLVENTGTELSCRATRMQATAQRHRGDRGQREASTCSRSKARPSGCASRKGSTTTSICNCCVRPSEERAEAPIDERTRDACEPMPGTRSSRRNDHVSAERAEHLGQRRC